MLWLSAFFLFFSKYKLKQIKKMRYINGLNQLIATELSDLKYGEYMCTECNKVITRDQVVPDFLGQSIFTNSILFCSNNCRSESHRGYDRRVSF